MKTVYSVLLLLTTIAASSVSAQQVPYQSGYHAVPPKPHSGFNQSRNWMQGALQGRQWQQGDGHVYQDRNGFFQWMGNGKTKWKFYFDMDFQMQMDAWLKQQNRRKGGTNPQRQQQQQRQQQHYWQGQMGVQPPYHQPYIAPSYSPYSMPYYVPYYAPQRR